MYKTNNLTNDHCCKFCRKYCSEYSGEETQIPHLAFSVYRKLVPHIHYTRLDSFGFRQVQKIRKLTININWGKK